MRAPRLFPAMVCMLAAAAVLCACGGNSESGDPTSGSTATSASRPAPAKAGFPAVEGRTLRQVLKAADGPTESIVAPAAVVFYSGENRYPFGVFDRDRGEIPDAEVALYYAKAPAPPSTAQALDQPAVGPFPASIESLASKPAFRANGSGEGPEMASVVDSTQLSFPGRGEWGIAAILEEDGELKGAVLPGVVVGEFKRVPKAGEKAPVIHTPTPQDVGGDLSKITTRVPPDTQNKVDYAEALGREPVVLLFATPEFCQSRVCGPVVDVAEQAKREYGDKATFIHMEIYNGNDPENGVRPQVRAFHLPSEPYLFTIDRHGIVRAAVEGAFGLKLMHDAVDKAIAR